MTDKDFEINSCYDFKNPKILGERVFRDRLKILILLKISKFDQYLTKNG